jgi:hypothetical protein
VKSEETERIAKARGRDMKLIEVIAIIPVPAKIGADILTVAGWVSALSGALTQFFGLLAAILSFVWAALRLYEAITRKRHCIHATLECPVLCPPGCVHWRAKRK